MRRQRVESASPEEFQRFLARWQHVAPGSRLQGRTGLERVVSQLQGWAAPVSAWEPDLLARRVDDYDPAWIDQLCHAGQLQWFRLRPPTTPPTGRSSTTRATPISLVHRGDTPWLLAAYRSPEPRTPSPGGVAELADILTRRGPRFVIELVEETGRLPTDVETLLWEGVAQGLFTADGFSAIRALTSGPRRTSAAQDRRVSRLRRAGTTLGAEAGRWSLVPDRADDLHAEPDDPHEIAEAVADQLLQRWGVIFYDLVAIEKLQLRWRDLQWALRRLEDRGQVLGGRFVRGFAGEQFALPQAADQLRDLRNTGRQEQTITVCGADPLNLTAVLIPGPRVPARRTESVELVL
jgi:ATP-dependent Lhr-like helicase